VAEADIALVRRQGQVSIAHLINPIIVPPTSDLFVAQPITFETMRRAREFARRDVDVALFSAQYPRDLPGIPDYITKTRNLERSILDAHPGCGKRELPFIKDILDRLFECSDAEYLVYTNVDIAVAEHFYLAVAKFISEGYDAFSITRRTLVGDYKAIADIPLMYADRGKPHRGWDCFVFRRDLYPAFDLDDVVIGVPGIGRALLCNLIRFAKRFGLFRHEFITFHIGNDGYWKKPTARRDGAEEINLRAALRIVKRLYRTARNPEVRASLRPHFHRLREEAAPWRRWEQKVRDYIAGRITRHRHRD
jgi:hypothetical protein